MDYIPKDKIVYVDQIPVIYPLQDSTKPFYIDANNNLIFTHDLLKSSFFLLYVHRRNERGHHLILKLLFQILSFR